MGTFLKEDESEMNDFQKIMALAKKRLNYGDVEFTDSEGKGFSDYIEITQDGLLFTFDGLKDFLQFFFPDIYGEENSEGEWDATNYESIYTGNFDFYGYYSDDAYNDWIEGYLINYFDKEHFELLSQIFMYTSPEYVSIIKKQINNSNIYFKESDGIKFLSVLNSLGYEDRITNTYLESTVMSVSEGIEKLISDRYCNCLEPIGVDNYSSRYCFWKYELSWAGCMLLYARFGIETDKLLDLLREGINKLKIRHLPNIYELKYEVWDDQKFKSSFNPDITNILNECLEELKEGVYSEEFLKSLEIVNRVGGMDNWIYSKDKNLKVFIRNIDTDNGLITYVVYGKNLNRTSRTNGEALLNTLNQGRLFETKN